MRFLAGIALYSSLAAAIPGHVRRAEVARDEKVDYDGYHVYRVNLSNLPRSFQSEFAEYHTLQSRNVLEIVIPPTEVESFEARGFDPQLLSADLSEQIRQEARKAPYKRSVKTNGTLPDSSWFDSYHEYEEHVQFWNDLNGALPSNSEIFEVGRSYEDRRIFGLQLFGDAATKGTKPAILWHATVHAREWISTAVIEYLTYNLIAGYNAGDAEVKSFFDKYDFYIIPFHNPDGFAYSKSTDRLWRKNRQPRANTTCIGTDGNRNWNYQFYTANEDGSPPAGPCTQTFGGEYPSDTPENAALSLFSRRLALTPGGIRSFIDFHSYGQLILLPWGFSCNVTLPSNVPEQLRVGNGIAAAINSTSGQAYEVGVGCQILYQSIGNSRDYHYGALGAPYSWTVELRPASAELGGFVLPPEQIKPTGEEIWEGIKWMLGTTLDG